ncbi:peroxidase [Favolaschia claudopus]|uniref:Peroxidase n=1 Tax=Favolaschia claudopus TaxID=2862362 RepID=A0AAW0B7B7_9AGAR
MRSTSTLFALSACTWQLVRSAAVYHWPDPLLDNIDDQLFVDRFTTMNLLANDCGYRDGTSVAGQWLRMAFHDFATYDKETGKGGLDASIIFELDRPQNIGVGMRRSLMDYVNLPTEYVGMADIIAMGAVMSVVGCHGPVVPFRAGRRDATGPGPETVPEPQEPIDEHIRAFKRMGMSKEDMIALVACGHSLGGVKQSEFPQIVTPDLPVGITFQAPYAFNNSIVHEYFTGTTVNPLVVGPNIETRSDFRIFNSDNNATLRRLSDLNTFNQECSTLIARMIDTVPSDVTLTDVVEPINYKVQKTMLFPQNGKLTFLATIKILQTGLFDPLVLHLPKRTVTMFWKERTGQYCPDQGCKVDLLRVDFEIASRYAFFHGVLQHYFYTFKAEIPAEHSISHFWFEVDPKNGTAPFIVDNHGANYVIEQDSILYDPYRSDYMRGGSNMVVAVKDPKGTAQNVHTYSTLAGSPHVRWPVNTTSTFEFTRDQSLPPTDGYTFYSGRVPENALSNTLHADIDGKHYKQWLPHLIVPGIINKFDSKVYQDAVGADAFYGQHEFHGGAMPFPVDADVMFEMRKIANEF